MKRLEDMSIDKNMNPGTKDILELVTKIRSDITPNEAAKAIIKYYKLWENNIKQTSYECYCTRWDFVYSRATIKTSLLYNGSEPEIIYIRCEHGKVLLDIDINKEK